MRVLVTGGAGFIGSHTCDALLGLGHDVVALDALAAPVHRGGPQWLDPDVELVVGDVRDRDVLTRLLVRVDAVYHLAAYQDYLPDFSRFTDVNVTSTALLYEIVVSEGLDLRRVVVASSQSVVGEGLYLCPQHGEQTPGMRLEAALRVARWDLTCTTCGGALSMRPTPERVVNPQNTYGMSKYAGEMLALNLGRRYAVPTVAMRYSIVQGPRQSMHNAYSGACRIFNLHYRAGRAPIIYEDGGSVRDYVNIRDVVAANVLVLQEERAVGRVLNVGGGVGYTTLELAEIVRRQYGSDLPPRLSGEYRFGDTRHVLSDVTALRALGWSPRHGPEFSVAQYAEWLADKSYPGEALAAADERMRRLGVVRTATG